MVTRVISGIGIGVIMIASLILGGWVLFGLCCAISFIGLYEFYKVLGITTSRMGVIGYVSMAAVYTCVAFNETQYLMLVLIVSLMTFMMAYVIGFPKHKAEIPMAALFGIIYVGIMLSYIYQTRVMEFGIYYVWLIFICSWGSDTCAYFTGVLFGKHKMTPKLSPKKTIEGLCGGIFGAAVIGAIYGAIIGRCIEFTFDPMIIFALAGAIGGLFSVVGDLAASGIKRDHDIKDYGKLIPGHGGILDRFDSVIFTAPVVYWILILFM